MLPKKLVPYAKVIAVLKLTGIELNKMTAAAEGRMVLINCQWTKNI